MFGGENLWIITFFLMLVLVIAARVLMEKLLDASKTGACFGIGLALFGIYSAVMLLVFNYFCADWQNVGTVVTAQDCFVRLCVAFVLVNMIVLAVGCMYYFAREKRKISEIDKMKLTDL